MLAVSVVWWPWYARLVRGQVLTIKEEPYVEAARAAGATMPASLAGISSRTFFPRSSCRRHSIWGLRW